MYAFRQGNHATFQLFFLETLVFVKHVCVCGYGCVCSVYTVCPLPLSLRDCLVHQGGKEEMTCPPPLCQLMLIAPCFKPWQSNGCLSAYLPGGVNALATLMMTGAIFKHKHTMTRYITTHDQSRRYYVSVKMGWPFIDELLLGPIGGRWCIYMPEKSLFSSHSFRIRKVSCSS